MFPLLFVCARIGTLVVGLRERFDATTLAMLLLAPALAEIAIYFSLKRWVLPAFPVSSWRLVTGLANLVYTFHIVADLRVLRAFHRPLDLTLYREGSAAMPVATMLGLFTWIDWSFIALALLGLAWPVRWQLRITLRAKPLIAAALVAVIGAAYLMPPPLPGYTAVTPILRLPGLALANMLVSRSGTLAATQPVNFDPLPGDLPQELHSGRAADKNLPNVLFIVLESTGSRYVFDEKLTLPGKGVAMPFLRKLRGESLYLARHYATANSSPRALFSLFTGLYPEPSDEFFSLKKGIRIRTWNRLLPAHRGLLVTPCVTEWYFPNDLFRYNGISEIIGKSKLVFAESQTEPADARNEVQTADYFAQRLLTLPQPFFSVYISFAPHYPYHDYGAQWRITNGRTRLDRYVDNLRLLDAQLEKFFKALQQRGSLNNTIVVLVGDHSEAFKQHAGNYIHSLFSYEENLAVPALIWYPARLRPREIDQPTSHVDIGPTLLDLMEVAHRPRDFQGVSLLRNVKREHIFAYGNEGTITVYGNDLTKTQRLRDTTCRWFNLQNDSAEKQPLACDAASRALQFAASYAFGQMPLLQKLQLAR